LPIIKDNPKNYTINKAEDLELRCPGSLYFSPTFGFLISNPIIYIAILIPNPNHCYYNI